MRCWFVLYHSFYGGFCAGPKWNFAIYYLLRCEDINPKPRGPIVPRVWWKKWWSVREMGCFDCKFFDCVCWVYFDFVYWVGVDVWNYLTAFANQRFILRFAHPPSHEIHENKNENTKIKKNVLVESMKYPPPSPTRNFQKTQIKDLLGWGRPLSASNPPTKFTKRGTGAEEWEEVEYVVLEGYG